MRQTVTDTIKGMMPGTEEPMMNAIDIIKADHRKVDGMFKEFETVRTKRERLRLLNNIVKELSIHATMEEKLVYPLLVEEGEKTKEAYEEHHVVKLVVAEIADYDGSEDNIQAKVKVLAEIVKHHVKEEERDLLPKLRRSGHDLKELGMRIMEEKRKLQSNMRKVGDKSKRQVGGGVAKRPNRTAETSGMRRRAS